MTLGCGLLQLAIGLISYCCLTLGDFTHLCGLLGLCRPLSLQSLVCTIVEGDRVSCAESSRGKRKGSIVREGKELRGKEWEQMRIKRGVELATVFRN